MSRITKGCEKHNNEYISYIADSSMYPEMMGYEQTQADIDAINKLGQIEDLMEKYNIDNLVDLEIALNYYNHRYDDVQTRRMNNDK